MTRAVDFFAGWGGFTLGAEAAGVHVVYAADHWPLAVETHSLNHPRTRHECQDLRQADWSPLPRYDMLLAAPPCQGHSTASRPKRRRYHDALRATAWAVVDCAEVTAPKSIIVENVLGFRNWQLYPLWCQALETLGYHLQELELVASQHGVAQRRTRLFVVGTKEKRRPIRLRKSRREPAFASCVDWRAAGWRPVSAASAGAQKRIAAGRARHGRRFLVQHISGHRGISLDEPIRTITTKDQWAIVDGHRYRPLTMRELARGMGFPDDFTWPTGLRRRDVTRGLGNAVCPPVAEPLVRAVAA